MHIFAYSPFSITKVLGNLGKVEYSYSIVMGAFKTVLDRLGPVTVVEHPEQVDAALAANPTNAIFFSFTAPHLTRMPERCRTVPVLAWEFDTLPTDAWYDDEYQDWRTILGRCGSVIVHSHFTAASVRAAMGDDFPLAVLPAPVWDNMAALRSLKPDPVPQRQLHLASAVVLDTADPAIASVWPSEAEIQANLNELDSAERASRPAVLPHHRRPAARIAAAIRKWRDEAFGDIRNARVADVLDGIVRRLAVRALPPAMHPKATTIDLAGVVFTAVFNPRDGRKNWKDMLSAFCEAHAEHPDAVLVMKLSHWDCADQVREMLIQMARSRPFTCRVLIVECALDEREYSDLIEASSYVVNASHGEGQCLPLMEFMAAGRPAIAPLHTAMLDYIADDAAFIVRTWREPACWPHDPRRAYRALRHQVDWPSLVEAYRRAYDVAKGDPARYFAMSEAAIECTRRHCSREVVQAGLQQFLSLSVAEHNDVH